MTAKQITRTEVAEQLLALNFSRRKNPREYNACVYTDRDGCHCIVGHVMVELGVQPPGFKTGFNSRSVQRLLPTYRNRFTREALQLLGEAQSLADRHAQPEWRSVVSRLRSYEQI